MQLIKLRQDPFSTWVGQQTEDILDQVQASVIVSLVPGNTALSFGPRICADPSFVGLTEATSTQNMVANRPHHVQTGESTELNYEPPELL
jgi:hypothetical protein